MARNRNANTVGHLAELFHPTSPLQRVVEALHPASPMQRIAEAFHPQNTDLLQELLAHLRGGVPHPGPTPHGFGPGGAVTGAFPGAHSNPLQPASPAPQDVMSHTNRPADLMHAFGNNAAAAPLWMQRHPGAMGGHGGIPPWVQQYLMQKVRGAGPAAPAAPPAPGPVAY